MDLLPVASRRRSTLAPKSFSTLRLDPQPQQTDSRRAGSTAHASASAWWTERRSYDRHVIAMEGLAGEIRLADFDTLELSNLNRIPASVLDLGVNKAVVAARRIAEIDPYLRVVVEPTGIRPGDWVSFLMDSTSSLKSATRWT